MALIEFDEEQTALMNQSTYLTPIEEESNQSDFSALAEVMNSTVAAVSRGRYENETYNTSEHDGTPFNRESLVEAIQNSETSPEVQDQLFASHITDWQSFEARRRYLPHLEEVNKQVQENYSTAGMLALGIPLSIIDLTDPLAVFPVLKAGNMVRKSLNLPSRLARVAVGAGEGAAIGLTTTYAYEAFTGVYEDDTSINSAMVGALLGGGIKFFMDNGAAQKSLNKDMDGNENFLDAAEAKQAQKDAAQKELDDIDAVLEEVGVAQSNRTNLKTAERAGEATDAAVARNQAEVNAAKLDEEVARTEKLKADHTPLVKATKEAEEGLGKKASRAESTILKVEKGVIKLTEAVAEIKKISKLVSTTRGQITKVSKQIEALKNKRTKEANASRIELKAKLTRLQNSLEKKSKKGTSGLLQKLAKLTKVKEDNIANTPELIKSLHKEATESRKSQFKAGVTLKAQRLTQEGHNNNHKVAKEARSAFKIPTQAKEGIRPSAFTDKIKALLGGVEDTLSPKGLKKLLDQRGLLTADLAKMANNDFKVSTLRGIKRTKQNFVDKLNEELVLFEKMEDFRQTPEFKKLSPEMRKWTVSPIEGLLNVDNDLVSGLASMLHTGTLHHGKVNTMTAWVLRGMLDNTLERMHKSLTNNWQLAKKDGYVGKLDEFEAEVLLNAHKVNGQMKRDLYTAIDGAIVGLERDKIVQSRVAGVARKHFNDNKWVTKSTDEVLDYYEGVHTHGNKIGMEAFKGSLGKGYINRVYSSKAIEKMGRNGAIKLLVDAQESFARATNSELTPAVMEEFTKKAEKAIDGALDKTNRKARITRDLGVPRQSSTSSTHQRTIDAFDDDIAELMDDNLRGVTQLYGRSVHGRLALKERLGVDNDTQLATMIKSTGATQKQIDDFNVIIETIKSSREVSDQPMNPFTRAVKALGSYSSIMHTMAFAVPTITEVASIAKEFGWGKTMNALSENPAEIYRMYRFGTPSEKNTVEMMISYGDAHFSARSNRMETENFDSAGRFQEFLDDVVRRESVYSGLMPITDMLRMTTAVLSVDFMAGLSVANKVSKTDLKRLNDMGFDMNDLERIRNTLRVGKDGRIGNPDRKTWGELDREITAGVMTMVERTILDPNGATLPKFMTDVNAGQFVPRVMMKFMRFPFESYERMLGRGLQEADAKQAAGFAGNVAMWSIILAAKDALKDPADQEFSDEDGFSSLAVRAFQYNSFTTLPLVMADTASGLLTGENVTNNYRANLAGVVGSDLKGIHSGKLPFSTPGGRLNIGDGVSSALNSMFNLEEAMKDD